MSTVTRILHPKTYRPGRLPPVLRHVLRDRGWVATPENYTLYWKNGRMSSEERAFFAKTTGLYFNHFPDSHWITKKVRSTKITCNSLGSSPKLTQIHTSEIWGCIPLLSSIVDLFKVSSLPWTSLNCQVLQRYRSQV